MAGGRDQRWRPCGDVRYEFAVRQLGRVASGDRWTGDADRSDGSADKNFVCDFNQTERHMGGGLSQSLLDYLCDVWWDPRDFCQVDEVGFGDHFFVPM